MLFLALHVFFFTTETVPPRGKHDSGPISVCQPSVVSLNEAGHGKEKKAKNGRKELCEKCVGKGERGGRYLHARPDFGTLAFSDWSLSPP